MMPSLAGTRARPNAFIVGAPRSGTTAMFRLLGQHPDVSVSAIKEPYYFCTDFHEESDRHHGRRLRFPVRTEAEYLALFRGPSRAVVLEATPAYLRSREAPVNIHAFDPHALILVMVREPIELLRSLHAKMLSRGQEVLKNFREAIEAESARRTGLRLPSGLFWPSSLYYSEWIAFAEQIERYRAVFSADRVKVVVYDDFERNNVSTYEEVVRFLGLNGSFQPAPERTNKHRTVRFPVLTRFLAWAGDLPVKYVLSERLRREFGRAARRVYLKPVTRAPLDPVLRRELGWRFRPEVERLSAVLQRDLVSLWEYPR
jgi:Sulfotransferase family